MALRGQVSLSFCQNLYDTIRPGKEALPSPRITLLPQLGKEDLLSLPYPPNSFLGARDVSSPYGTTRVYEWGPEGGRRLIFVHGLSTPSPVFGPLARALVDRGCRVLLYDLWGTGYSDSPRRCAYNTTLYMAQAESVLCSSPINWLAGPPFVVVGFSLGATIALMLAAAHRQHVDALVLMAPGGLMGQYPPGYGALCLRYPRLFPRGYTKRVVASLHGLRDIPSASNAPCQATKNKYDLTPANNADSDDSATAALDFEGLWKWQLAYHKGFVHAFCAAVKDAPIFGHVARWRDVASIISSPPQTQVPLTGSRMLVLLGSEDPYVDAGVVDRYMQAMLSPDHVRVVHLQGARHNFVVDEVQRVAHLLGEHVGLPDHEDADS